MKATTRRRREPIWYRVDRSTGEVTVWGPMDRRWQPRRTPMVIYGRFNRHDAFYATWHFLTPVEQARVGDDDGEETKDYEDRPTYQAVPR